MARPVHSRRVPSTTLLFRISIQRPQRRLGRSRSRSRLRARRGRSYKKSTVRFRPSRRPLPPFFLFMERHRRQLQRKHPNLSVVQMAKRMGQMWQRLPKRDKDMYKAMASHRRGRSRARRSRSTGPKMSSQKKALKNIMVSFTTKAESLRNFLMSYL